MLRTHDARLIDLAGSIIRAIRFVCGARHSRVLMSLGMIHWTLFSLVTGNWLIVFAMAFLTGMELFMAPKSYHEEMEELADEKNMIVRPDRYLWSLVFERICFHLIAATMAIVGMYGETKFPVLCVLFTVFAFLFMYGRSADIYPSSGTTLKSWLKDKLSVAPQLVPAFQRND